MIKDIKSLFLLLTSEQRKKFFKLQLLVITMALLEVVGIGSIGPFMALVGDPQLIQKNKILSDLYVYSGLTDQYDFLFFVGSIVLVTLLCASMVSMYTTWRLSRFSFQTGTEIADRLYAYYLNQNWLFHTANSSAALTKQISTESFRVTTQVILPFMQMNARLILVTFIAIGLFIFNPIITSVVFLFFVSTYFLLFFFLKRIMSKNGEMISSSTLSRFSLMNLGFGGIKEIKLLNRQDYFINLFKKSGENYSASGGLINALTYVPRYLMELLAFGVMIFLTLVQIKTSDGSLSLILPTLGIYGLAGFKMLPALQNTYSAIAEIRSHLSAFYAIREDLLNAAQSESQPKQDSNEKIQLKNKITLHKISYTYPQKQNQALQEIQIELPANKTIGIVGFSGSGKSTLVDLLLGLIPPTEGSILIDEKPLNSSNLLNWQKGIGFVPQNIFLCDGSLAENIAFGIPKDQIDLNKINEVIRVAHLDVFVKQLQEGINTQVGERGVQLSGGQRQRIAIARALYNNPNVLVFDEATSALDGITETKIMSEIDEFKGQKTVILVAHRLKTVKNCDLIILLENGKVRNQGTFEYLLQNDELFSSLEKLS